MKLEVKSRYAVTPNEILNDPDLSLKAKGLFGYIQSKPDNWIFSVNRMIKSNQLKEGKDSIISALHELEEAGLLVRKQDRGKGQYSEMTYVLFSSRQEIPYAENPPTVNPSAETPEALVRKNISKKEYSKKEKILSAQNEAQDTREKTSKSPNKQEGDFINAKIGTKKIKLNGLPLKRFMEFWKAWNDPRGRAEAAGAWIKIEDMDENKFKKILTGAEEYAKMRSELIAQGLTPKMAQGWLNGERWEDVTSQVEQPQDSSVGFISDEVKKELEKFLNISDNL